MNILSRSLPLFALVILGINMIQYRKHQSLMFALIFFVIAGLALCIAAAVRDGYGFREDAIIPFVGTLSTLLSMLGASLIVLALVGLLTKNLSLQQNVFLLMNLIFVVKLLVVEGMVWGIL